MYERSASGLKLKEKIGKYEAAEITHLVKTDEILLGSKINGEIFTYTEDGGLVAEMFGTSFDTISSLDYNGNLVVGSSDKETKLLAFEEEFGMTTFSPIKSWKQRYMETKFSPDGRQFLGVEHDYSVYFNIVDVET